MHKLFAMSLLKNERDYDNLKLTKSTSFPVPGYGEIKWTTSKAFNISEKKIMM